MISEYYLTSKKLDGFRIVQRTDLPHCPFTDAKQRMNAIDLANCIDADIVALVGDDASHQADYVAPIMEMMAKVKSTFGTFAILGNHNQWTDDKANFRVIAEKQQTQYR